MEKPEKIIWKREYPLCSMVAYVPPLKVPVDREAEILDISREYKNFIYVPTGRYNQYTGLYEYELLGR